jgi:hypothetical protein
MKNWPIIFVFSFLIFFEALAQRAYRRVSPSRSLMTYDIGASSGTYNDEAYSEITFGINWYFLGPIAWRNAVFNRFGSRIDSVLGLDTSLRYTYDSQPEPGEIGFAFFGGPGYRIANERNSAFFAEAGAVFKIASLSLGMGIKSMSYTNPGSNPKTDNILFIILAGGGVL